MYLQPNGKSRVSNNLRSSLTASPYLLEIVKLDPKFSVFVLESEAHNPWHIVGMQSGLLCFDVDRGALRNCSWLCPQGLFPQPQANLRKLVVRPDHVCVRAPMK